MRKICQLLIKVFIIAIVCCSISPFAQDNTQFSEKTDYWLPLDITSTARITGPKTVLLGHTFNIDVKGSTSAGMCNWVAYENSVKIGGSSLVFGNTVEKTLLPVNPVLGDNTYEFWFRGIVGAHNWPDYTKVLINVVVAPADTTPPIGSVIAQGGAKCINTIATTLTLSASDPETGVSEMRFSNDNNSWSPWEPYAVTKLWYLAPLAEGEQTVYAEFRNGAGLTIVATDTIIYVIKPYIESITPPEALPTEEILIQGFNFDPIAANNKVKFTLGDRSFEMTPSWSNPDTSQLKVLVPCNLSGDAKIQVINPLGTSNECLFKILNFIEGLDKVMAQLEAMVLDENISLDIRNILMLALEYCQEAQIADSNQDTVKAVDWSGKAIEQIALAARQGDLDIWYKLDTLICARAAVLESTFTVEQAKMMVDILQDNSLPDSAWTSMLESLNGVSRLLGIFVEGDMATAIGRLTGVFNNLELAGIPAAIAPIELSQVESLLRALKNIRDGLKEKFGAEHPDVIELDNLIAELEAAMPDGNYNEIVIKVAAYFKEHTTFPYKPLPPGQNPPPYPGTELPPEPQPQPPEFPLTPRRAPGCSCSLTPMGIRGGDPILADIRYEIFNLCGKERVKLTARDSSGDEVKDIDHWRIDDLCVTFTWSKEETASACFSVHKVLLTDKVFYSWSGSAGQLGDGNAIEYIAREITVGTSYTEVIKLKITDGRNHPTDAFKADINITVKRISEEEYRISVNINPIPGSPDPVVEIPGCCPFWFIWMADGGINNAITDIPKYIGVDVPAILKVNGATDVDDIMFFCALGPNNCPVASAFVAGIPDAVRYKWDLAKGSGRFLYGNYGEAVLFKATSPGDQSFGIQTLNFGLQAPEGGVQTGGGTTAVSINLQINGVSEDDDFVGLNDDDDNNNNQPDLQDNKPVDGENDLVPLKIILEPKVTDGQVRLKVTKGLEKIRIWEIKGKQWAMVIGNNDGEEVWDAAKLPTELLIEGVAVSADVKDVGLKATFEYNNEVIACAKTKATVFTVDLEVCKLNDNKENWGQSIKWKELTEDEEDGKSKDRENFGGIIGLNGDDDNHNYIADKDDSATSNMENDLVPVKIKVNYPKKSEVKLTLTQGINNVRVWEGNTQKLGKGLNTQVMILRNADSSQSIDKELLVEGVDFSGAKNDIILRLEVETCWDEIKLTVIGAEVWTLPSTGKTTSFISLVSASGKPEGVSIADYVSGNPRVYAHVYNAGMPIAGTDNDIDLELYSYNTAWVITNQKNEISMEVYMPTYGWDDVELEPDLTKPKGNYWNKLNDGGMWAVDSKTIEYDESSGDESESVVSVAGGEIVVRLWEDLPDWVAIRPPGWMVNIISTEFVVDANNNLEADNTDPAAPFVYFGLWDNAYDGSGNILNNLLEGENFIGSDSRRFYLLVTDKTANLNISSREEINVNWYTILANGNDDDHPAISTITLTETGNNTGVFASRAVMLVTNNLDLNQSTNTGLLSHPGNPGPGNTNHRTRRATINSSVKMEYNPARINAPLFMRTATVFRRNPDERRRVNLQIINYMNWEDTGYDHDNNPNTLVVGADNGVFDFKDSNRNGQYDLGELSENYSSYATNNYINEQISHAQDLWTQAGLQFNTNAILYRPIPQSALDAGGDYPGSANNPYETNVLNDVNTIIPDNTLTVVFLPLANANAYTTISQRTTINISNKFFVFINNNLNLNDETLGHECFHALYNRFDENSTDRQYFTFNTNAPLGYGLPLPDVRIYRRIHNITIDWVRRARKARFPIENGISLPTPSRTTGNTLVTNY